MKKYNIEFKGYWRDCNAKGLPECSGIYIIYTCVYNPDSDKVSLKKLFYIGQSKDINREVNKHKRREEFFKQAKKGEEICYAYAEVPEKDLDIVENALIYTQGPGLNDNLVDNYNHDEAEFHISGKCRLLDYTDFKIDKDGILEEL